MNVSERVKLLISKAGMTQKEFANRLAISAPRLNNYLSNRHDFPQDILIKIAELTESELAWILTGTGSMYNVPACEGTHSPPIDFITLPVVADIAAGLGIEAEDVEPTEVITIPTHMLTHPGPYFCFRVSGVSMEPELHTGDLAIIAGFNWEDDYHDTICAFRSVDGLLIKRLIIDHKRKKSYLIPINVSQKAIIYDENDPDIRLIGRLIAIIRRY